MLNREVRALSLGAAALLSGATACAPERVDAEGLLSGSRDGEVLFAENFDSFADGELPPGWWVEGGEAVYVSEGRLVIRCDPEAERGPGHVCTVWNDHHFSGDVRIDFDAHVIASSIKANNINFFLHYTHPEKGSTVGGSRNLRLDGMYNHYHDLNGYIFTFLNAPGAANGEARFRMRRCPGFELMVEGHGHHCRTGRTYHVTITKRADRLSLAVDGTVYLRGRDEKYNWTAGLMGFRTFHTDLWVDNFRVTRPG